MLAELRRLAIAATMVIAAGSLMAPSLQAGDALQVDDAKLDSFVDAYRAVHEVASAAMERMQSAKTDEDFKELQKELEPKFEAAIEDTAGITLAEFREIEEAAISDETLGKRIVEKMQAAAVQSHQ